MIIATLIYIPEDSGYSIKNILLIQLLIDILRIIAFHAESYEIYYRVLRLDFHRFSCILNTKLNYSRCFAPAEKIDIPSL